MRAAGYYRPDSGDPRAVLRAVSSIEEYCRVEFHSLAVAVGPGDPPRDESVQFAELLAFLDGLGRGEALVIVPGARHLAPTLDGLVERLLALEAAGGDVRCTDSDLPDALQNGLETLPFAGRSPGRSRRIRDSVLSKAARGEVLGRTPYGYTAGIDGSMQVMPAEADVVRRVFSIYAGDEPPEGEPPSGGPGLRRIAATLNADGLRSRAGHPWTPVTLSGMLRNRAYTGSYIRYGMRIVGNHDRIVPRDVFNRAQEVMSARQPVRRERVTSRDAAYAPYPLGGGLARCGVCGRGMHGLTRRRTWTRADGSTRTRAYRYYECPSRAPRRAGDGQDHPSWRAGDLETALLEMLRDMPDDALAASFRPPAPDAARDAVRTAEAVFLQAVREIASGHGMIAHLAGPLAALQEARLAPPAKVVGYTVRDALQDAVSSEPDTRRAGLAALVDRVMVYPGRAEPVLRPPL